MISIRIKKEHIIDTTHTTDKIMKIHAKNSQIISNERLINGREQKEKIIRHIKSGRTYG